jgi:hypothetical protein
VRVLVDVVEAEDVGVLRQEGRRARLHHHSSIRKDHTVRTRNEGKKAT